MGRRSDRPELEFGSDSFLDVICNIVGILIILIVVVAVKVERQPEALARAMPNAATAGAVNRETEAEFAQRQSDLASLNLQHSRLAAQLQELSDRRTSLSKEHSLITEQMDVLQDQIATQNAEVKRQTAVLTEAEKEAEKLSAEVSRLLNNLAGKEKMLSNAIALIQEEEAAVLAAEEKRRTSVVETVRLQEVLDETPPPAATSPRLLHRIMPVSRKTDGEEVMFRLIAGRISEVPLNELMKQAVDRVRKRISMLQRFGRLEDIVGPIAGYRMTFSIEMNAFNSLEYLQYGGDGGKFTAFRQVIVPDDSLVDESAIDAVKPGSVFRQRLEAMPADSAVTIVVYEDSFSEFAALREIAHGLQIRVAARPLPVGTDITISANGSASRAQ